MIGLSLGSVVRTLREDDIESGGPYQPQEQQVLMALKQAEQLMRQGQYFKASLAAADAMSELKRIAKGKGELT